MEISPFDTATKVGINQCSPLAPTQTKHDLALFKENMSILSNAGAIAELQAIRRTMETDNLAVSTPIRADYQVRCS